MRLLVLLSLALGVFTASCGGAPAEPAALTTTTAAPTTTTVNQRDLAESRYVDELVASHTFGVSIGDARGLWLRKGYAACDLLERTHGDVVRARFAVSESLVDYSKDGWSEPGLAERSITVVNAAHRHLCPDAPYNP